MKTRSYSGFTLIELMIVVVVIALLTVVAYPSYRDHVAKAKRSEARVALLKIAQVQERYFSDQNKYADTTALKKAMAVTDAIYSGENPNNQKNSSYVITIESTDTTYTLTAAPQGGHTDDICGNFTLTERGERAWSKSPASPEKCRW